MSTMNRYGAGAEAVKVTVTTEAGDPTPNPVAFALLSKGDVPTPSTAGTPGSWNGAAGRIGGTGPWQASATSPTIGFQGTGATLIIVAGQYDLFVRPQVSPEQPWLYSGGIVYR